MITKTFYVPNISCQHCVMTIKRELGALAGVRAVEPDLQSKQVSVSYETEADLARIKETLVEIGYPVAGEVTQ